MGKSKFRSKDFEKVRGGGIQSTVEEWVFFLEKDNLATVTEGTWGVWVRWRWAAGGKPRFVASIFSRKKEAVIGAGDGEGRV